MFNINNKSWDIAYNNIIYQPVKGHTLPRATPLREGSRKCVKVKTTGLVETQVSVPWGLIQPLVHFIRR